MIRTRGVSVKGLARALLLTTLKTQPVSQRQSCADLRGRWGSSLPRLRDRPEWPAERACPLLTRAWALSEQLTRPSPAPASRGGWKLGVALPVLPHPRGRARAAWLARQIFPRQGRWELPPLVSS